MTNLYEYIENKTNKRVAAMIDSQLDLDDNAGRVWINPTTGAVLSNFDYFKMVIKEALNGCSKKDYISVADKIINCFKSENDFKYIDFDFNDNLDGTYTVEIDTNLSGYKEYRYGYLEWDNEQKLYVLWTGASYSDVDSGLEKASDEGVSYFNSLVETKQAIQDEIENSLINETRL